MLRRFKKSDYDEFGKWFAEYGAPAPDICVLPEIGFVVEGKAMGFLLRTDSKLGIVEYFVARKSLSEREKYDALFEICQHIYAAAEDLGMKYLKCETERSPIIARLALRFGLNPIGTYSGFLGAI